jgi:hypothetical protein
LKNLRKVFGGKYLIFFSRTGDGDAKSRFVFLSIQQKNGEKLI